MITCIEDFLAEKIIAKLDLPQEDRTNKKRVRAAVSALTYAMIAYFKDEYLPVRRIAESEQEPKCASSHSQNVQKIYPIARQEHTIGMMVKSAGNNPLTAQLLHTKKSAPSTQLPSRLEQRFAASSAADRNKEFDAEEDNPFKDIAVGKMSFQ